jgi:hypothetical protein
VGDYLRVCSKGTHPHSESCQENVKDDVLPGLKPTQTHNRRELASRYSHRCRQASKVRRSVRVEGFQSVQNYVRRVRFEGRVAIITTVIRGHDHRVPARGLTVMGTVDAPSTLRASKPLDVPSATSAVSPG